MHRRLLRSASLAVVTLLALSACSVSSDDDDEASPSTTESESTETTEAGEPARGVTADTIKLGFALIDFDQVREQFGIELGSLPDELIEAVEAAANARGGVNGRDIELVIRRFLPVGTEPSEQVCRELIEDEQVFAVMGSFLGDAGLCVTETYETPYFGGFGLTPEIQERSKAPYLTTAPSEDETTRTSVELLVEEGVLDGKKVAVYTQVGRDGDFLQDNVLSVLEAGGIDVVSTAALSDFAGDAAAAGAELDRIFQRFEADGADTIINVVGLETFAPALERMDWAPQLVFLNGQVMGHDAAESFGLTDPNAELEGAIAALPGADLDETAEDPSIESCIEDINANSDLEVTIDDIYPPTERAGSKDYRYLPFTCLLVDFTVDVLTAAGDNPTVASILDGIDGLELDLPGNPGATLARDRWGASAPARIWEWSTELGYFAPVD